MRRRTLAIGALLFALPAASRLSPARAGGDEALLTTRLQQIADTYVAQRAEAEHITGLALQVSLGEGSPAIAVASGTDGRFPDPQPMAEDTLFQVGSNGKGFTAAIILKLEAAGQLSIDQTVGDWLPQYPAWKSVTIRSLLNMTSGIPDYAETVEIAQKIASDIHHQFTSAELIAAVDPEQGSTVPPTMGYSYSNTNYILAGLIIEKVSGLPYKEALRTLILKPLRLRDTYYADGPYPDYVLDREPSAFFWYPTCPAYQPQPCPPSVRAPLLGQDVRTNNLSWGGPAGAMVSTLGDLTRWYRALFEGRVLPPQQLREMTSLVSQRTGLPIPDVTVDDPAGFGLGLQRYYIADLDGSFWAYPGGTLGSRVLIAYWPQYDLVITASANSAVASTEDKMVPALLLPAFAALKDTGVIQGTGAVPAVPGANGVGADMTVNVERLR
jgi:D-alanyl-D-alanine carboxypeptidase